ncbi:MAG TPA: S41 family peptidase, partial [Candidatus Tripitaka californicus]|uniref:S41 family peptidase n=1 Tax=Candidatus Tripitaka californicus TaxID=3367616 RepID=UPI0040299C82
ISISPLKSRQQTADSRQGISLFLYAIYCLLSTACILSSSPTPSLGLTERDEQYLKELDQALTHIKESYYGTIDMESLVDLTLQSVLDSLDKDSKVVKGGPPSLDFVRGLEEETPITEASLATAEIAYVKIGFFGRRTGAHFQKALESLGCGSATPTDVPRVKGILLDLRDNPGGHLQSALEVLRHFVPPGKTLLIEKTRGGEKTYLSEGVGARCSVPLPIVIFINVFTASSADIVAAVLRYHCGARVVGEKSKGKGTIQEVIPLGTRTLILTVGEYLLPDGSSLRDKGVLPDLEVKVHEEQLQSALSLIFGVH